MPTPKIMNKTNTRDYMEVEKESGKEENKSLGKIKTMSIDLLDDGSFMCCNMDDKYKSKKSSHKTINDLISHIKESVK